MAALHDALKSLGPLDYEDTPLVDLNPFLLNAFSKAQLIVDSVPIPPPSAEFDSEARSRSSSSASSASEISISSARSAPPPPEAEALQKEWKYVKLDPKTNPLGIGVYRLASKDGKGSWFARRSVHEGLEFTKWKRGLEREFPETMKVQGAPGEGNIRGIGGERSLAYKRVEGVGKMAVYLLSAQFPGPTTPRDFVTMFLTSDSALSDPSQEEHNAPRQFFVISKPCNHPDAPPREGFIRGCYESVEFIREIPLKKGLKKSASTTNIPTENGARRRSASTLGREAIIRNAQKSQSPASDQDLLQPQHETRARGKTISYDMPKSFDFKSKNFDPLQLEDEGELNAVEWVMISRSDPGGNVPRFLVDRGTPGGIVADASKFLNWACAKDIEDLESDDESGGTEDHESHHNHASDLHNYQTNGHLVGIGDKATPADEPPDPVSNHLNGQSEGGLVEMATGVAGAASDYVTSPAPGHLPDEKGTSPARRDSRFSITSASSAGSFASALESFRSESNNDDVSSTAESTAQSRANAQQDKELQKLEERKRKLEEKLSKAREKESSKKSEDAVREEEALRKAEEKHEREVKRQEEKYQREVEKLARKKEREQQKAEERKRKAAEKDERTRLLRELEELKAEVGLLKKEKEILSGQVGDLQAENTALAARVGKLGSQGEQVLLDVRSEIARTGRIRAGSLKGLKRTGSFKSISSGEKESKKENVPLASPS